VRHERDERRSPAGVKRNRLCELARGDVIAHWDDNDWMAPWRVRYQVERLLAAGADVCGLDRPLFYDPAARQAWQYVYPSNAAPWVYGATLCYTKVQRWGHILTRDISFESATSPSLHGLIDSQSRWSNARVQRASRSPSETPHIRDTWPLSAAAGCR
jgi:hypothetical protein